MVAAFGPYLAINRDAANLAVHATVRRRGASAMLLSLSVAAQADHEDGGSDEQG